MKLSMEKGGKRTPSSSFSVFPAQLGMISNVNIASCINLLIFPEHLKEITKQCKTNKSDGFENNLILILEQLNCYEKAFLADYFCNHVWNLGSAKVLKILQDQRILTASEYILSQQDDESIQFVLNDFLETEFGLLTNLFVNSIYDPMNPKLSEYLNVCVQNLLKDVEQNPKLNDFRYFSAIKSLVPREITLEIIIKHIIGTLDLHSSGIKDAFRNFIPWINKAVDNIQFIKNLYQKMIIGYEKEALKELFKISTLSGFKEWKYYLVLLQTISSQTSPENQSEIKKYFKSRLRQIVSTPKKESMLHLILSARAANATTNDIVKNIISYSQWYKQNIADMSCVLSVDDFKKIMNVMQECIPYETDEEYLQIHITTAISPPIMCSKIVQEYKSRCKTRLAEIKRNLRALDPDESIILTDSD